MRRPTLHTFAIMALLVNALTPRPLVVLPANAPAHMAQFDVMRLDCPQSGQRVRVARRPLYCPPLRSEPDSRLVSAKTPAQTIRAAVTQADFSHIVEAPEIRRKSSCCITGETPDRRSHLFHSSLCSLGQTGLDAFRARHRSSAIRFRRVAS